MKKKFFSIDEIKIKLEQYCIYQDRCHSDVEKKLSEYNLIPQAKEQITLHLLQENFLNEERFAKNFAVGKFKSNKWGLIKIKHHLQSKGVSSRNIEIALDQIDASDYRNMLISVAKKKWSLLKENDLYKKKNKLFKYLYSRGFESDLVSEVVKKL